MRRFFFVAKTNWWNLTNWQLYTKAYFKCISYYESRRHKSMKCLRNLAVGALAVLVLPKLVYR